MKTREQWAEEVMEQSIAQARAFSNLEKANEKLRALLLEVPDKPTEVVKPNWRAAAEWLRNNYQNFANIDGICTAMIAASPECVSDQMLEAAYSRATGQTLRDGEKRLAFSFAREVEKLHGVGTAASPEYKGE